ncbi:MAG: protein phosphatase 2C domain-containing protein [Saprospiraceae bacterium]
MHLYKLSQIGEFHVNHNEDYLVSEEVGKNRLLLAVMDGCSSGTDSHFAATLIGKLLRKLARQEACLEFARQVEKPLNQLLDDLALQLFTELGGFNRQLDLAPDELLSTLILALIDTRQKQAETLIAGDGLVHINGNTSEYENDNKPDYLGYHLQKDKQHWLHNHTTRRSDTNIQDFSISTDGIFTFKNVDGKIYPPISEAEILSTFLDDISRLENPNKLKRALIDIQETYGLRPSDDLTLIRMVLG